MVLRVFKVLLRSPVFETERMSLWDFRYKFKLHPADYPKIFYCKFLSIASIFISFDNVCLQFSVTVYPMTLNFHRYLAVSLHLILYRNTNKMQLCNRIYYSKVYWRLKMFRAAHRSLSGALNVFAASGLYTHVVTGRCQGLGNGRSPYGHINQRLQIV